MAFILGVILVLAVSTIVYLTYIFTKKKDSNES